MSRVNYFVFVIISFIFVWISPMWLPISGVFELESHQWIRLNWMLLPIHAIILFGLYSGSIVMYRIFKINDYPQSKQELFNDIEKAKQNLQNLGFRQD